MKDPSALQTLRELHADLFVSIRFGAEALGHPARGVLNVRSGLLPQYRGVLATFRALLNGDAEICCTLHWIDSPGIDVGGIVEMARTPVVKERSLLWLRMQASDGPDVTAWAGALSARTPHASRTSPTELLP